MIKPFPYQEVDISKVMTKLEEHNKVLFCAFTGYGKSAVIAFISNHYVNNGGKVLILCHKEELISQTGELLNQIGLTFQKILPSTKGVHENVDAYICMIETVNNRLKRKKFSFPNIELVIADECHIMIFDKVFQYFKKSKIIGFTATPIVLKKTTFFKCKYCNSESIEVDDCCGQEMEEWNRPFSMSELYDDIVVGADVKHLIDFGQLVPEITFTKQYIDSSTLKTDSTGEYTSKSLDETYGNDDAVFNVKLNYLELCKGKRTIIFNPSTKTNRMVYESFKEDGLNVKMYDSVNDSDVSRSELVEWFNNNDDAILCNVSVFTTGFNSREVQAIIINRATKSLALYLQMAGRGGRSSKKIFKDSFILIDGGDNVSEFGEWSQDRDWEDIFFNGIGKPRSRKVDIMDVQDCPECGGLFPKRASICDVCGHELPVVIKEKVDKQVSENILTPIREIPPPNAKTIYEYTKSKGETFAFALNVLYGRVVDMFIYYRVTKDLYESTKTNGKLDERLRKMIYPCYFFLMKQEDIQTGARRKLDYVVEKAKEKVEIYYNGRKET